MCGSVDVFVALFCGCGCDTQKRTSHGDGDLLVLRAYVNKLILGSDWILEIEGDGNLVDFRPVFAACEFHRQLDSIVGVRGRQNHVIRAEFHAAENGIYGRRWIWHKHQIFRVTAHKLCCSP